MSSSSDKKKTPPFPFYHKIEDLGEGAKFNYYRCNFPEENSRFSGKILEDSAIVEKCFKQLYSWKELKDHIKADHNMNLKPIIDFCDNCEIFMHCQKMGLSHYLMHANTFITETVSGNEMTNDCEKCLAHKTNMLAAANHFGSEVTFADFSGGKNTEKTLEMILDQSEEDELDAEKQMFPNDEDFEGNLDC